MGRGYPHDWNRKRRRVYRRDNYKCQKCGKRGGRNGNAELHAHHKVPIARGGSHKLKNLQTLCKPCHRKVHSLGGEARRAQTGVWGVAHRMADNEKNERYGGCPSCDKSSLEVRWDRLAFRNKVKVVQCTDCGAMFDERITEVNGERSLKLHRVSSRKQIVAASSASRQERERMAVRQEMEEREAQREAQELFGCCPNCGERQDIFLSGRTFRCSSCKAKLKRRYYPSDQWKMHRGHRDLVGTSVPIVEWEQIAIEQLTDMPDIEAERTSLWRKRLSTLFQSETAEGSTDETRDEGGNAGGETQDHHDRIPTDSQQDPLSFETESRNREEE